MVATKRLSRRSDSSESNGRPMPSSPLRRMHEDDVSGMEAMLRRSKQLKTTMIPLVSFSDSKMIWSKNDELVILGGILDYQNEKELSYRHDWDAFYSYIKDSIEANFSKQQLINKIKKLKKRFTDNQARSNDGKGLSFTDTDDDDIFKLSMIIWANNETECASNENKDQAEVLVSNEDVPCVEHEGGSNMDRAKVPVLNEDVPYVDHEPVSYISKEIDSGEKEKSKVEDGVDESCVLLDALEPDTLFQSLGKYRQKLLLQNLRNLGAESRKELTDEWKALLVEEVQLSIKKQYFSAKLANAGASD